MKKMKSFLLVIVVASLAWQCNPKFDGKDNERAAVSRRDIDREKEDLIADFHELRIKIDSHIKLIDEALVHANGETKQQLMQFKFRLIQEKKELNDTIQEVERSTQKTWSDISRRSKVVLTEVKIEAQKWKSALKMSCPSELPV